MRRTILSASRRWTKYGVQRRFILYYRQVQTTSLPRAEELDPLYVDGVSFIYLAGIRHNSDIV
jgi:hypothetical protein